MELLKGFGIEYSEIRDPVYDLIEIPVQFKEIIDNALFQRLRRINQLPLEDMVYPSARHSRFEHSLGTMYLAMLASANLLQNSKTSLNKVFKKSTYLKYINTSSEKTQIFILAAGLVGLLHDIGHGPFSHTLEHALEDIEGIEYDHEKIGIDIIQKIKHDLGYEKFIAFNLAFEVLDKNKKYTDLDDLQKILRDLIDHDLIDVDKGDYVLRDAYHCAVPYGSYDFSRLWSHIELIESSNGFKLAFHEKVASETWSLRFARFNMFKNVYKHHIRQITDAHLSEIIKSSINIQGHGKLIPIDKDGKIDYHKFIFWTDEDLLKELSTINKAALDKFLTRQLYKRTVYVSSIHNIVKTDELKVKIIEKFVENNFDIESSDIILYKTAKILPPVKERCIQNCKIIHVKSSKNLKSVAEYLEFEIENTEDKKQYSYTVFINKAVRDKLATKQLNKLNSIIEESIINFCDPHLLNYDFFKKEEYEYN